jgi:hypothetical protein
MPRDNRVMSTAAVTVGAPLESGRRPGYWKLFASTAVSQLGAGLCLFVVVAALSAVSLVGANLNDLSMYGPWVIDGPWPLVASLAWGTLVVGGVSAFVRRRLAAPRPSRLLTMTAVAIAGYAPWLLVSSPGGRAGLSLALLPATLAVIGYDASGCPRRLPRALGSSTRALRAALAIAALALIVPFTLLHPFAVQGTGIGDTPATTGSGYLYSARPGRLVQQEVGLQGAEFPITVTRVQLLGNITPLRIVRVAPGSNPPVQVWVRVAPGGPSPTSLPFHAPPRFPVRLGARHTLWIGWAVTLRHCPTEQASVTRIRISYRELGLALTQTVGLARNSTLLRCP